MRKQQQQLAASSRSYLCSHPAVLKALMGLGFSSRQGCKPGLSRHCRSSLALFGAPLQVMWVPSLSRKSRQGKGGVEGALAFELEYVELCCCRWFGFWAFCISRAHHGIYMNERKDKYMHSTI